ncbi:RICIN domain-containing protein [Paucibacter sediminis]|uniref:RICIN domain-containing protein n=1 Tax=Paucibacter sediminis TaxID=3019553 RepID=A0AA95SLD9_9BURK|nr:RICIN domain-containing protein [Paucibacter sp. S2-9]WIT12113.1 RICIN domain-containing protein [Paucibacter sp. S2-9]
MSASFQTSTRLAALAALASLSALLTACGGGGTAANTPERAAQAPAARALAAGSEQQQPDCPAGSIVTALTPDAGVARVGSVYSSSLYDPAIESGNQTHQPRRLKVRVTLDGQPVAGCTVRWEPRDGELKSGWVFPDSPLTDAYGRASAWWTAGSQLKQALDISIRRADGSGASAVITGEAKKHQTRANSIHINWSSPAWDRFSAEVTPLTWEPTTYYEVIGFNGGYGGVQSHQLLFSLWDVNGISPEVIDPGISSCSNFGGEGTGIKCESPFKPAVNVAYRFELELAAAPGGKQDVSMYFTDTGTGLRQKLATMRLPKPLAQAGAYGFVEDWSKQGNDCLDNKVRAASYAQVRYRDAASGQWVEVHKAKGTAVYTPDHNEICSNYQFAYENGRFKLSTGGTAVGQPLNLPGGPRSVPMPWEAAPPPKPFSLGLNTLVNLGSAGMALDVVAGGTSPGTNVEAYPLHGGAAQQWDISVVRPGVYKLINPRSGLALDVAGTAVGSNVDIYTANGSAAQEWNIVQIRPGVYALINVGSGLALDIAGGSMAAGANVLAWTPGEGPTQEWQINALP